MGGLIRTAEQIKAQANQEYKVGNYAAAVDLYSQSIKLEPTNATYYGNRSAALMMIKKYSEASKDCQTAIRLDASFVKVTDRSNIHTFGYGHVGSVTQMF